MNEHDDIDLDVLLKPKIPSSQDDHDLAENAAIQFARLFLQQYLRKKAQKRKLRSGDQ